jgi:hypothetical protein
MCVSLAPATFSSTRLYAGEVSINGRTLHTLGYQNTVQDSQRVVTPASPAPDAWAKAFGDRALPEATGNAMFLPFPAVPGTMNHLSVVDTSTCPNFLKDMEEQTRPRSRGVMKGGDALDFSVGMAKAIVFDHDIYTVVLANDPRAIPEALSRVPVDKRPAINKEIFDAYAQWYKQWTFALCCFNNKNKAEAKPLLWAYQPMFADYLFLPALDAHDGKAPNLKAKVDVDHAMFVGSYHNLNRGTTIRFTDDAIAPSVRPYLQDRVFASFCKTPEINGDFIALLKDVRVGDKVELKRVGPPNAV